MNTLAICPGLFAAQYDLWYALPLIVAVSLVYSATRHEAMRDICVGAVRTATWIIGFMFVLFLILFLMSSAV